METYTMTATFNLTKVRANNASTATIEEAVLDVLSAKDNACYEAMEPRLIPPGIAGSRFYDQAIAVQILLKHDNDHEKFIHSIMVDSHLSERMLWETLYKVLRRVGFKMKSGRLVGLLEKPTKNAGDNGDTVGTPDIE